MAQRFDKTIILAAPPHTRARYSLFGAAVRARQAFVAAVVIIVPGAWLVWLVWLAWRARRSHGTAAT